MGGAMAMWPLVLLVVGTRSAFAITDAGLLPNGNFEQGPSANQLKGTKVIDHDAAANPAGVSSWRISGSVEHIKSGTIQRGMLLVVPEGEFAIRINSNASVSQTINLDVGSLYSLAFSAARTCAQNEQLDISVGAFSSTLSIRTLYSSNGWDSYAWAFSATSATAELSIGNPAVAGKDPTCGPVIDAIAIKKLLLPSGHSPAGNNNGGSNLLVNGDFEIGPYIFPNMTAGVLLPPSSTSTKYSAIPGWVLESPKAVKYIDVPNYVVPSGSHAVELIAGRESAISQEVATVVGRSYKLRFVVGDANNSCEGSMVVEVLAGGVITNVPYESHGTGGFERIVIGFDAVSKKTHIVFRSFFYHMRSDDRSSLCGPTIDDVKLVTAHTNRRLK